MLFIALWSNQTQTECTKAFGLLPICHFQDVGTLDRRTVSNQMGRYQAAIVYKLIFRQLFTELPEHQNQWNSGEIITHRVVAFLGSLSFRGKIGHGD